MKRYNVTFQIEIDEDVKMQDVVDFVKYELHEVGQLSCDNPLADTDIEALYGSVKVEEY